MNPKTFTFAFFLMLVMFLLFADKDLGRSELNVFHYDESILRTELESPECDRTKALMDIMLRRMYKDQSHSVICESLNPDK